MHKLLKDTAQEWEAEKQAQLLPQQTHLLPTKEKRKRHNKNIERRVQKTRIMSQLKPFNCVSVKRLKFLFKSSWELRVVGVPGGGLVFGSNIFGIFSYYLISNFFHFIFSYFFTILILNYLFRGNGT